MIDSICVKVGNKVGVYVVGNPHPARVKQIKIECPDFIVTAKEFVDRKEAVIVYFDRGEMSIVVKSSNIIWIGMRLNNDERSKKSK